MDILKLFARTVLVALLLNVGTAARGQDADDDDIWRKVDLQGVDYSKQKNYSVRLYAYYRYTDDGVATVADREFRLYRIFEGICSIDIRYGRDEDDGADVIVGRNLVHPDRPGRFMDFYELKPYTFLEKARREPKHFTVVTAGDTTRVATAKGLQGTAVRDTLNRELRIHYNALAPDTALSLNLLVVKARIANVVGDAVYRMDDADADYVPQGNLKHVVFDGDAAITTPLKVSVSIHRGDDAVTGQQIREDFHEHTEIYVDSVVYMTRDEYRADRRLTAQERRDRSGYTAADIDRLRAKHGVPPLTAAQRQRIEDQRDWDDLLEQWERTRQ